MDVRLINPFIAATEKVFDVMLGMKLKVGKPSVGRQPPELHGCVSAAIHMVGGATGTILLLFPRDIVLSVARMLDDSTASFDDGLDAIGELANMIAGSGKRTIGDRLIEISIPQVIVGQCSLPFLRTPNQWLSIPFKSPLVSFKLAASFSANSQRLNAKEQDFQLLADRTVAAAKSQ